jgi:hypothetical protein
MNERFAMQHIPKTKTQKAAFPFQPTIPEQLGVMQTAFPPVIGVELLGVLLDKAPASIFADRSRAPHKLPPACTPPGNKFPRWILADVIAWLRSHQEVQPPAPAPAFVATEAAPKRGPGAPTKAECVRARRAAAKAAGSAA